MWEGELYIEIKIMEMITVAFDILNGKNNEKSKCSIFC